MPSLEHILCFFQVSELTHRVESLTSFLLPRIYQYHSFALLCSNFFSKSSQLCEQEFKFYHAEKTIWVQMNDVTSCFVGDCMKLFPYNIAKLLSLMLMQLMQLQRRPGANHSIQCIPLQQALMGTY